MATADTAAFAIGLLGQGFLQCSTWERKGPVNRARAASQVKLKNQSLNPVQVLAVVVAVLSIGLAVCALYLMSSRIWHRRNLRRIIPKYLDAMKVQKDLLCQAIEKYHDQHGFYPPNHGTNVAERALVNPLYYELVGTRWNTNIQQFGLPTTKQGIGRELMEKALNMSSFSNTLPFPQWPTNYIEGLSVVGREEKEIIMVTSSLTDEVDPEFDDDFVATPWRYAADPAEHNQGKFDLWIDVEVLDRHFVIGNWETAR